MVIGTILVIISVIVALLLLRKLTWLPAPYKTPLPDAKDIPQFKEESINFTHEYNKKKSLPFMGAAVFDMRGDGTQYIYVGGGLGQPDQLFVFKDSEFSDITQESKLTDKAADDTTYCVVAIDVNADGLVDLFVTRESGVYLYINNDGKFSGEKLDIPLNEKSAPLSLAVADLQKNGLVDIFVCAYIKTPFVEGQSIFNKEGYGASSLLLRNNGDNTFTDITEEAGLSYVHNTFQAVFVDLDGSGELDLVVAHDTGQIRTYKNLGDLKFKKMPNPTSDVFSYPMGIAVGDYNGNGRPDLFFSNIGPFDFKTIGASPPNLIVRGDLRKDQTLLRTNIFLRNEGNFKFTDVAEATKTANYEFGWGALFQDFNNNGKLDIALAQNYIGFPVHWLLKLPCRLLAQLPDQTYASIEKQARASNPLYAISPLIADFTGNGYSDLVYTNLNGPLRVLLNQGGKNNYLKVVLKNEPASLGATVVVTINNTKKLTQFFVPTQGLCTYQTNALIFGLEQEKKVQNITVTFTNGHKVTIDAPKINTRIHVESKQ